MISYNVYVHTNKINGLRYVGITSKENPEERWQSGQGYHKQTCFYNAIKKYGWDNFEHEIVATGLTPEQACAEEQRLIALWNTTDRLYGYNRSSGGKSGAAGVTKTPAQIKASRETMTQLWQDDAFIERARIRTVEMNKRPDIRAKRSDSNRKRVCSEATRKKMSENRKGKGTGPFTEERKQHMREHHAGGMPPRRVLCIDTGELFDSINDAARAKGTNKVGISGCCRGISHYNTAGGYHWRFAE